MALSSDDLQAIATLIQGVIDPLHKDNHIYHQKSVKPVKLSRQCTLFYLPDIWYNFLIIYKVGKDMEVYTNKELSQVINDLIEESGYKKNYIADKLGIANQNLNRLINKSNLSIDEVNRILSIIGYKGKISISKKD